MSDASQGGPPPGASQGLGLVGTHVPAAVWRAVGVSRQAHAAPACVQAAHPHSSLPAGQRGKRTVLLVPLPMAAFTRCLRGVVQLGREARASFQCTAHAAGARFTARHAPAHTAPAPLLPALGEKVLSHADECRKAELVWLHAHPLQRRRLPRRRRLGGHGLCGRGVMETGSRRWGRSMRQQAAQPPHSQRVQNTAGGGPAAGPAAAHVLLAVAARAALHRRLPLPYRVWLEPQLGVKQRKHLGAAVALVAADVDERAVPGGVGDLCTAAGGGGVAAAGRTRSSCGLAWRPPQQCGTGATLPACLPACSRRTLELFEPCAVVTRGPALREQLLRHESGHRVRVLLSTHPAAGRGTCTQPSATGWATALDRLRSSLAQTRQAGFLLPAHSAIDRPSAVVTRPAASSAAWKPASLAAADGVAPPARRRQQGRQLDGSPQVRARATLMDARRRPWRGRAPVAPPTPPRASIK